ncbi:hypothetical protein BE11_44125 [Sorangium cellulosum]|nr:hypothetical protein BE11_44125 [Sorangium cellulosum]
MLDLARARIGPVVRGLFPAREHDIVLGVLERSIVLLTPHNIDLLLAETTWPGLPPPGSPATPGREVADT